MSIATQLVSGRLGTQTQSSESEVSVGSSPDLEAGMKTSKLASQGVPWRAQRADDMHVGGQVSPGDGGTAEMMGKQKRRKGMGSRDQGLGDRTASGSSWCHGGWWAMGGSQW